MPAINVRLTEAELAYLREQADAEGRSMNNYVRRQLFASSPTPLRTRIERRRVDIDNGQSRRIKDRERAERAWRPYGVFRPTPADDTLIG